VRVIWTPQASRDRVDIWDYIFSNNPQAAVRMDAIFSDAVTRLADYPELGQVGIVPGTREMIPHDSYRLVYEISSDAVWILALVHVSRQWPLLRD
jgi:addiction module RelE/StbE family toxin